MTVFAAGVRVSRLERECCGIAEAKITPDRPDLGTGQVQPGVLAKAGGAASQAQVR